MDGVVGAGRGPWVGRVVSATTILILVADAAVNLLTPQLVAAEQAAVGFAPSSSAPVGIILLVCAILYVVPQTAVIGGILIAGFCGGAICAHLRLGEIGTPPQLVSVAIGILAWVGLWLRSAGLRALVRSGIPM